MLKLIGAFLISTITYGACVDDRVLLGSDALELMRDNSVFFLQDDGRYKKLSSEKIIPIKLYSAQIMPKREKSLAKSTDPFGAYNKKYIKYYTYPRMQKYLKEVSGELRVLDYQISVVGKSLAGRDLFYVGPKRLDPNKKTIVMFGRHHGDEGTANWIIEGFLDRYLSENKFSEEFQLVLYPMINPDGAMDQVRYNKNGRDLNRSWSARSGDDEIALVHGHLKKSLKALKKVVIALDMHGSFYEDFIYRVKKGHRGINFYSLQQKFIDELGAYDPWQAGDFQLSNGHPKMARIILINHYDLNALTHESIRNIPLRNERGRTQVDLLRQGHAIHDAIKNLY